MSTILKAISNIMAEVGSVPKAGENKFHGYKYTTAADILHKLQPLMAREGLVVLQSEKSREMLMEGTVLAVTYDFTLTHRDGETWPEKIERTGMSSARNTKGGFDDKALNKCHTQAHKYFHLTTFEIPTGDYDDPDADEDKAPSPRKSSARAKKDGDWEKLEHDLLDAQSARSLQRLWDGYRQREYSSWSPAWRQQAEELFAKRLAEFDLKETLEDSLEAELPKPDAFAPSAKAKEATEYATAEMVRKYGPAWHDETKRQETHSEGTTEFVTPTAVQVHAYRERVAWLKDATTSLELKKRAADLEHLTEIEKLTVPQRNNLREFYREHRALLTDKERQP